MGKKYTTDEIGIGNHSLDSTMMDSLASIVGAGLHSDAGYTSNVGTVTTVGVGVGVGLSVSIANRTTEPQITLTNTGYYFQAANTGYVGSGGMQNWNTQESVPNLNPTTDWFTSLRIGHGHPVNYYSNTLGIQMTGADSGRIYTRTIADGTAGSWKKYYHTGDFSAADVANGVTAHGWGNHANAGYLTTYTDTNTQLTSAQIAAMGYLSTATGLEVFRSEKNIDDQGTYMFAQDDGGWTGGARLTGAHNGYGVISMHLHTGGYYGQIHLSSQTSDMGVRFQENSNTWGSIYTVHTSKHFSTADVADGKTAHGWGNHADEGYLTSYTDTNTTYNFVGSTFTSRNSGNPIAIDSATSNMTGYTNSSAAAGFSDGGLFVAAYSTSWVSQIFSNFRTGELSTRGKNSGTWQAWRRVHDSGHFSTTDVANGVTAHGWGNHAGLYADASHSHAYLPLTGGTLTGTLAANGGINMGNTNLTNVNHITINDPGSGEGIEWTGGNGWKIFESNDSNSNGAGNLQFSVGSVHKFRVDTSGHTTSIGSSRAPIFYDSNNTGYYVNPASSSQLSSIYYNEWLRNNRSTATGLYWETVTPGNGWHIYPGDRRDMTFRTGSSNGGIKGTIADETARGYVHWTTSNEIGFLNSVRSWSLRVDNSGNSFSTASSRAPIFYDSNNTGYYVNPASTSNFNVINATGGTSTEWNTAYDWGNHASAGYVTSSGNTIIGTDSDINTSGAIVVDQLNMTDGVIQSHSTRTMTLGNLGYTGATNANYITNNNQLSNGAGYLTNSNDRNFITDSRGSQRAPSYYNDRYAQWDFQNSADTLAGGDAWHGLLTVAKWSSHHVSHRQEQLIFTGNDLKRRTASSDSAWGSVKTIYDSGNLSLSTLGYTGATNANYITNNNQLTNGAGYTTYTANQALNTSSSPTFNALTLNGDLFVNWDGTSSNIRMGDTDHGERRIHCNSNRIGFLNSSNGWGSYCEDSGNWVTDYISYAGASMRAPIFYDSDDTNYYVNPNARSRFNEIQTTDSGATPRYDTAFYVIQGQHWYGDTSSQVMYLGESSNPVRLRGSLRIGSDGNADGGMGLTVAGSANATSSFRAPIFYDSDNTGYYVNPNSTSNMVSIQTTSGNSFISKLSGTKSWLKHITTGALVFAPSASNNGSDWSWANEIRFSSKGTITSNGHITRSDERLKTKITDLLCDNIDVAWKSYELKSDKGEKRVGVIAQELEETHPEFVVTDSEGFKSVKYIDLLIAKIAELEARLQKLEK